ncbi:hypothetical protein BGZ96_005964 [Linnemannia gamsii]|uniref:Uncharacterized protein n=1 Tax=Linnemannia gamsii TaxID=64522 RepID=A0ABQ7K4J9_9FUNG|nr:hypothetical protein BGZ96_005964 [Linnemannia gamsii]
MASVQTSTTSSVRRNTSTSTISTGSNTAMDCLALSLSQINGAAHSNTTPLSTMAMAHALLVHSSRHSSTSSPSLSSRSVQRSSSATATAATTSTTTSMSKSSQDVPAKHTYPGGHDADPTWDFDEAEKSAYGGGYDCIPDSGRLQQYLLRSDEVGVRGQWCAIEDGGELLFERGGNCRQSFNQQHYEQYQWYGEDQSLKSCSNNEDEDEVSAATMTRDAVSRCVTPSYLDFLMNDSDASNTSGSDSGIDNNEYDLDPAALVASMDPSSPYYRLGSSTIDEAEILQSLVEFGRTPQMFDDTPSASMSFFISPLAISQLARGLWTRSESACVIIHTRLPQRTSRFDDHPWSDDALRMLNLPNAGGSSLLSEVLSCEMLYRCLGARLAKTEMEIKYFFAYQPMTDYTVSLPGLASGYHVGVSVTRAFAYKGAYRRSECRKLLKKKLSGIKASTRNVMDERLFKQILHVWVPNGKVARTVQATYRSLPVELTSNSVVVISVVNAAWVFNNRR